MSAGVKLTEQQFQDQLIELAELLGWTVMHVRKSIGGKRGGWVTPTSVKGWPDLTLWHERDKRLIFVEVKTDAGRLRPEQQDVLASLARAGQEVHVWRPRQFNEAHGVLRGLWMRKGECSVTPLVVSLGSERWQVECGCLWRTPTCESRRTALTAHAEHVNGTAS